MSKSKELSVEEQIAKLERETQEKIKELRNSLTWEKRFKSVIDPYIKSNASVLSSMDGYADHLIQKEFNNVLAQVNLAVKYHSATFDNDFYEYTKSIVDASDFSEYPVFTIYKVLDENDNIEGFVKLNSYYSSYNGNEFNGYSFVKPKQITCTIFEAYNS